MGFANQLKTGETYLLFLDSEIETFDNTRLFIKSDDYLLMPAFSYDHEKIGWAKSAFSVNVFASNGSGHVQVPKSGYQVLAVKDSTRT